MRMLARLAGPPPPRLLVVDPRRTPVAERAAVHLAPRPGTNLALLNALLHELIGTEAVDHDYIDAHTLGYAELVKRLDGCTPEWAAEICRIPAADIRHAADVLG